MPERVKVFEGYTELSLSEIFEDSSIDAVAIETDEIYLTKYAQMAAAAGYATFFWSLAYVDWQTDAQPTRETALEKLTGRIHNGAIVLLHSTSATNAAVLEEVILKWKEMGYTFGTLTELCTA